MSLMDKENHYSLELGHAFVTYDGVQFRLSPTFAAMDRIGTPAEIVETMADVMSDDYKRCTAAALDVIDACSDEPIPDGMAWRIEYENGNETVIDGAIKPAELVILARHLLQHGLIGADKIKSKSKTKGEKYTETFDASHFVSAAVIHFGMTRDEAWGLTMTEFQRMLRMKFPDQKEKEYPTQDEYMRQKAELIARRKAAEARNNG